MHEGLKRLYSGDFDKLHQERMSPDVVVITLSTDGESEIFRFKVRDLYGENEEVLEHEVIDAKPPKHIQDRMKEAAKAKSRR